MELELDLVNSFHLGLVTVDWLGKLRDFLDRDDRLEGRAIVTSDFNEDRFMGPESVVKYRFRVRFPERSDESALWTGYNAEVEYHPRRDDFKMRNVWWSATWKDEPNLAELPPLEGLPEPDVVRSLEEGAARSWGMVPVSYQGKAAVVAVADPEQLERAADIAWRLQRPVRLRRVSEDELNHILDAVHGPLEPVDFLGLIAGQHLEGAPCERDLWEGGHFLAGLGDRCLRLDWPAGAVSVEKVGERISAFFQLRDWPGCRVRPVAADEWAKLCELAEPDEVWDLTVGEERNWRLRTTSAARIRKAERWGEGTLRDEPFTRLCLGLMLAGFEVGVEKEIHWL